MKVICVDNQKYPELEVNKPYSASFIFFIEGEGFAAWNKNMLNIEGQSEMNWYETKYFIQMDVWREEQLKQLGI